MAITSLIILRGPSAAGKSTVAKLVQQQAATKIAYFDHDYFREVIFNTSKKESKEARREILIQDVLIAMKHGFDVLIDTTLTSNNLVEIIKKIETLVACSTHVFYLEVSLEEAKIRHLARAKSKEFDVSHIEKWYPNFIKLGWDNELVLEQGLTEQEKADQIIMEIYGEDFKKD